MFKETVGHDIISSQTCLRRYKDFSCTWDRPTDRSGVECYKSGLPGMWCRADTWKLSCAQRWL